MNRLTFAASVLGILAVAAWAYGVNYRTAHALKTVERLRGEIAEAREDVQVLSVEWAYLNQPERLREMVETHQDSLGLAPLAPEHHGDLAAVPYPAQDADDPLAAALSAAASSILAQHAGTEGPVETPNPNLVPMLEPEAVGRRHANMPAAVAAVYDVPADAAAPAREGDEAVTDAIQQALQAAASSAPAVSPPIDDADTGDTTQTARPSGRVPLPPVAPRGRAAATPKPDAQAEAELVDDAPPTRQAPATAPLPPIGRTTRQARRQRSDVVARALGAPAVPEMGGAGGPRGGHLAPVATTHAPAVTPALAALGAEAPGTAQTAPR